MARIAAGLALLLAAASGLAVPAFAASGTEVVTGLGRYYNAPKSGSDPLPPLGTYVTADLAGQAVPSNQWYSSVVYQRWSQPLYAQPLAYRATEQGFEVSTPRREIGTYGGSREVRYLHQADFTLAPVAFQPADARLAARGDWSVRIRMADASGHAFDATVLHGSPFSYYDCSQGDVTFKFAAAPTALQLQALRGATARIATFTVASSHYAAFAPEGGHFESTADGKLTLRLTNGKGYFSVAALPDTSAETLARFAAAAFVFPVDTRVEWAFDGARSRVTNTFSASTVVREGTESTTLLGLYPHQWKVLVGDTAPAEIGGYDTIRGRVRLLAGNSFRLERTYHGLMPHWGGVEAPAGRASVESLLVGDLAKADSLYTKMGRGTYWIGKGLGATAQLLSVAEAQGKLPARDQLLAALQARLQTWFDGSRNTYFYHDARTGTLAGLPQEYESVRHMNDHHFHYGYWVMAAAHVALRDPEWASDAKWGGMVRKIIADIATVERGRQDFPFLRNFDPYEGHSWASGDADFDAGNNQESSSEAVNAWAALILWGEATGDRATRDLGIYLFTSEIASVQNYWFDLDREVLPAEYGQPFASMVFGGKYSYNTWWTQEPRQIMGINLLPITTASSYLAMDPGYFSRLADRLPNEVKAYGSRGGDDGTPPDIWQDVIASAVALGDSGKGMALWKRGGSVEFGEPRTHTNHWLWRLAEIGTPDFSVTADTALYAVFKRADGQRTYLAWNAGSTPLTVAFSDGHTLKVAPRALAQSH